MKTLLVLLLCFSSHAFAHEDWFCITESSEIRGSSVAACGIGLASDEAQARSVAFDNAAKEFGKICASSKDCKTKEHDAYPGRTSCETDSKGDWKCYRLITYVPRGTDRPIKIGPSNQDLAQMNDAINKMVLGSLGAPQ